MDKTFNWCAEYPFAKFSFDSGNFDLLADEEEGFDEVLEELFSNDEYEIAPNRTVYPHSKICLPNAVEEQDSCFSFAAADVDLLSRLIDSQFSPGRSIPEPGVARMKDGSSIALPKFLQLPVRKPRRMSPPITSSISTHSFSPIRIDADVPTLLNHFNEGESSNRRHRHQPRRVKFVYDDPAASSSEEEPIIPFEGDLIPLGIVTGVKPLQKGKGKSPLKEKAAHEGKGKPTVGKGKAAKNKTQAKSPNLPTPPPVLATLPDPLIWDTPIWQSDKQIRLQFHNKKAWIIEKKRRKHWFRLEKLTADGHFGEGHDTRLPLWTQTGDRITRHYSLRFVIKNPKSMQLFFIQKKKRYVLTALRVFFLFSEQSTRMKLRILTIPGVVRRLVQLITCQTGLIQQLAVMLLASLSYTNIFVKLFWKAGAFRKLEPIIRNSRDRELNIWLSLLMRNLSQNRFIQRLFLEMPLLDVMLDLVAARDQEPDVVKYLLQTFCFVCRNRTIRNYLVVKGSFVAVGDLLFSPFRYIQYLTFRLLQRLLHTKSGNPIFRFDKSDGMSLLIDFISDITQRKLFPLCIKTFEYVLLAPAIARKMIEKNFYRILMDLAMERTYENIDSVQEFALKTVTQASEIEEERRIMHELGYEAHVVFLLKSNSVQVQVAALKAIAGLSRRPTNQTSFFELGAHRIILFIMKEAQSDVREGAFNAIAFMMFRTKQIMNKMVSKGFGDVIHNAFFDQEETWETKGNALLCAILLRKNEQIYQQLRISISQFIPNWLLNANRTIRNYAAVCVGIFVTDGETRKNFADCEGHQSIAMACTMSQVTSKEKPELEFMRNLCFGLATLAVDEETVWSLINAGSLTPLWLLKNELDRVSQGYVGLALHRIVALDPFVRYALLGKLEENISLPHGLYDQGVISLSNPLRPIEYFLKQKLMGDRTIIYVSLPKQFWKCSQNPESYSYRASRGGLEFPCDNDAGILESRDRNKPIGLERLERSLPPQDFRIHDPNNPVIPPDLLLETILKDGQQAASFVQDKLEKLKILADTVVAQMGGPVGSHTFHDWIDCVDVGLSFLKRKLNSNCVPLGMVEQGNALHRAMLFKVLADVSKLPVVLVRGESVYQGWIEISCQPFPAAQSEIFILDLLYNPGKLLSKTSALAKRYMQSQKLPRAAGTIERPSFSTRDVRPLRGVLSQARQQLLQSNAPLHCTKKDPERRIQISSGMEKLRLFRLKRPADGVSIPGRLQYRKRLAKLFQTFAREQYLRRRTWRISNFKSAIGKKSIELGP